MNKCGPGQTSMSTMYNLEERHGYRCINCKSFFFINSKLTLLFTLKGRKINESWNGEAI